MIEPKVSVVVPCHDLGRYLDEAVGSVLAQTMQDVEVVVVDDGSRDPATVALLAGYTRPRTRVLSTENQGLPRARNAGIAASTGRYVCCLDADDRLEPTYLARAVEVLDGDPALGFVSSWMTVFGDEDWTWVQDRCDLAALLAEDTVTTAAVVRREALDAVGGFATDMGVQGYEDWDLWISVVAAGYRGWILPEPLFHYRRRSGSMSESCMRPDNHLRLHGYLLDKHGARYREHLAEVLALKELQAGVALRSVAELERDLEQRVVPQLERTRAELARLEAKLASPEEAERAALRREEERLRGEVAALRSSVSWRLTSPLRALHDVLGLGPRPDRAGDGGATGGS